MVVPVLLTCRNGKIIVAGAGGGGRGCLKFCGQGDLFDSLGNNQ